MATVFSYASLTNLFNATSNSEANLNNNVSALAANPGTGDLIKIQTELQKYGTEVGALAAITKEIGDTSKEVISKM